MRRLILKGVRWVALKVGLPPCHATLLGVEIDEESWRFHTVLTVKPWATAEDVTAFRAQFLNDLRKQFNVNLLAQ
jgi:hypothetical protein